METLPDWAQQNKVSFTHAATWLRKIAKSWHIAPTFYAVRANSGDSFECYMWNSKRTEFFNEADKRYVEEYG